MFSYKKRRMLEKTPYIEDQKRNNEIKLVNIKSINGGMNEKQG